MSMYRVEASHDPATHPFPGSTVDRVGLWMSRAYEVAQQSPDPSTQVGAIVFKSWDPQSGKCEKIGSACNDVTEGMVLDEGQWADRPTKYVFVEHAERAALYKAHACSNSLPYALVATLGCCAECARGVVASGIRVVVRHKEGQQQTRVGAWKDSVKRGDEIMAAGGVKVEEWSGVVGKMIRRNGKEVGL